MTLYLNADADAKERLQQLIRPTTIIRSDALDNLCGAQVILASETFQRTGSFKFRAAFNVAQNTPQNKLIAASSGNFGQALAYACRLLAKQCIVVMPANAAKVKVDAVRAYGGTVDFVDVAVKTRAQRVSELAADHPDAAVVSAFDDAHVIAGNATLGAELAAMQNDFDLVVAPIGGGGLLAGIIQGMKAHGCTKPIWGAEPEIANDAARSLREGQLVKNDVEPQTVADGVRTLALGERNWPIIKNGVTGILEVPEALIIEAFKALFNLANLKAEPTGAVTTAAVLAHKNMFQGKKVCCVVSGGNVDPAVFFSLLNSH